MSDQVRINGNVMSWGSISAKIDNEPFYGFTGVEFGDNRERAYVWGMGKSQAPRGRTRGKYTPEPGKLTGPISTVQALVDRLAAKASDRKSYGNVEFPVVIQFVDDGEVPVTVLLEGCVVTGIKNSHEESAEAVMQDVALSYMRVWRNGKCLFDATAGQ